MAVVTLIGYVVVNAIYQAGWCFAHRHHYKTVCCAWAARCVVFKEQQITANTSKAGNSRAVYRINVVITHAGKLVAYS